MRAPGMTMMKMPVFCWTTLASNAIIVTIFPVLTATLALLSLDRYVGTHFFTNDFGGNSMLYMNLIWIWGHPEVYVLVLPAFGIFSEVDLDLLRQAAVRLHVDGLRHDGHRPRCPGSFGCTTSSRWGRAPTVNAFFGIASMIISIPTGAKVFNWLFTMYRGRIRFEGRSSG